MSDIKEILLRAPTLDDGMKVFRLIGNCPPLDTNSSYCNLLQCSHFSNTSVAAELNDEIVGFISGYAIPWRPDTLFVWQVAVSDKARGMGLASKMLNNILNRPQNQGIQHLETTITEDNTASWALFKSFAKKHGAELHSSIGMDKDTHFDGEHESELLVRIGPFSATRSLTKNREIA